MKILIFDNYDSFTYNLVHAVRQLGYSPDVVRNDPADLDFVEGYDKIILSPGPGIPSEAGLLMPLLDRYADHKSILGVCLGHQAIGQHYGAALANLPEVYHGLQTPIQISVADEPMFASLPQTIEVGRYHSWVVDNNGLPECLEVTARDDHGHIMAMRHRSHDVRGVQFHPESVMTPTGLTMMQNWLEM